MWTMDNGQHYVQKQHNKQHTILEIDKQLGQIRPTVILGGDMAKKVTETSGSKICFLPPTCPTSSPREGEPRPLVCFCLWLVTTFPWKTTYCYAWQYCPEFKGAVQREGCSGSLRLDHNPTCHLLLNVCDMTGLLWSSAWWPHYWKAWLSICQVLLMCSS